MSEHVNTLVGKTWQTMKETLQWPSMGNSNVVLAPGHFYEFQVD